MSVEIEISRISADGPVQEGAANADDVEELSSRPVPGPSTNNELPETACGKLRRLCRPCSWIFVMALFVIASAIVIFTVFVLLLPCNKDLAIQIKRFTVRDIVVVNNNSTRWEVNSNIDLTLALQNPSAWVAPCDIFLREVELFVRYHDSLISSAPVYQRSSLKPSRSHAVSTTLTGNRSHVSDEAGVALEAQLLRNDNVTFVLDINARYVLEQALNRMVNHKICQVVAKTPQQTSTPGDRDFLSVECEEKVMKEP